MDRDALEHLLSRQNDGELTEPEAEQLAAELESDPEARRIAESWEHSGKLLAEFASSLGVPPEGSRRATSAATSPRSGFGWAGPLASAAGLLLALGVGMWLGGALRSGVDPADTHGAGPVARGGPRRAGDEQFREVAAQTRKLMPEHFRWAGVCAGQFEIGTSVAPMGSGSENLWFVTFMVPRDHGEPREVCRLAVIEDHEARLSWQDGGEWRLAVRPSQGGGALRLGTVLSYKPDGAGRSGMLVISEPVVESERLLKVGSARSGNAVVTLWARAEAPLAPSRVKGGDTL